MGIAFALGIFAAIVWGLTRAKDRIQMAGVCLVMCAVGYSFAAAQLNEQGGPSAGIGFVAGAYALLLYFIAAALAIFERRLAWKASILVFGTHILIAAFAAAHAIQLGVAGMVFLGQWLFFGFAGFWACMHKGTREFAFVSEKGRPSGM